VRRLLGQRVNRERVLHVMRDPGSQRFTESWFGKLEETLRLAPSFETLEAAGDVVATYVIHHHRPHGRLDYRTPLEVAATWNDGELTHLTTPAA
jgi:hypothetical protein